MGVPAAASTGPSAESVPENPVEQLIRGRAVGLPEINILLKDNTRVKMHSLPHGGIRALTVIRSDGRDSYLNTILESLIIGCIN